MKLPAQSVDRLRSHYQGLSVCVTGGAGFIGGHLVDALHSLGAVVTVIDDLSNSDLEHLAGLIDMDPARVRFVEGSVLDDDALDSAICARGVGGAFGPAAVVFHLAALGSVPLSIAEPQRNWSVNATGTLRVLEACRRASTQRVMFAASSSAYGDPPGAGKAAKVETLTPMPLSPYAAGKLAGENLLAVYAHCYGLSTVSLRYFNIFGPRQSADSAYAAVIAAITKRLLEGTPPVIYGDGRQTRDFTFVANAVLATLLAGASDKPLKGEVINVGTGRRISVLELCEHLAKACDKVGITPTFEPARTGDVRDSLADITRARQLLGYEPFATLEDGLKETVEWSKKVPARA